MTGSVICPVWVLGAEPGPLGEQQVPLTLHHLSIPSCLVYIVNLTQSTAIRGEGIVLLRLACDLVCVRLLVDDECGGVLSTLGATILSQVGLG